MNKPSKEKLTNDIENRLDDFFGEETPAKIPAPAVQSIEKLKSVVLSIDWEITDECLQDLIKETDLLLPSFENDRPSHALLRMLQALGGYIQKRKAQSHPDAIKRIMSVYKSFEKVTQGEITDEIKKKRIIAKEIKAFKALKDNVEKQRKAMAIGAAANSSEADSAAYVDLQKLEQAMSVVEQKLNTEVNALKMKLSKLQNEMEKLRSS